MGAMNYVTLWRLNLAGRLLHRSELSVAEIGLQLGSESSPAFSRAFKRHLKVSPQAFRNQTKKGLQAHLGVSPQAFRTLLADSAS